MLIFNISSNRNLNVIAIERSYFILESSCRIILKPITRIIIVMFITHKDVFFYRCSSWCQCIHYYSNGNRQILGHHSANRIPQMVQQDFNDNRYSYPLVGQLIHILTNAMDITDKKYVRFYNICYTCTELAQHVLMVDLRFLFLSLFKFTVS